VGLAISRDMRNSGNCYWPPFLRVNATALRPNLKSVHLDHEKVLFEVPRLEIQATTKGSLTPQSQQINAGEELTKSVSSALAAHSEVTRANTAVSIDVARPMDAMA
jgi:hypothetical protein